jgi:protein-S-isoprenylcysteine O-methyltransferase Ste14
MTLGRFTFALVSTAYLALAIPWEERSLVATFGPEYREYQRQVRWRMVPGLY